MAHRKKHATIKLLIGNRETTHRGATFKQALKVGESARLRPGCSIKWSKVFRVGGRRARTVLVDGRIFCNGRDTHNMAFGMGVRRNVRGWRPRR